MCQYSRREDVFFVFVVVICASGAVIRIFLVVSMYCISRSIVFLGDSACLLMVCLRDDW